MSPYRTSAEKSAEPEAPEPKRYRMQCIACFRTDCAVHGRQSAEWRRKCNHSDDDDRDSKRIPCAVCGQRT